MKSGNIENFRELSQFKNLKDFNNQIEQWMIEVKKEFTKSELAALKRLIRFSAKIVGVCHAKIGTVVSATHEKAGMCISRSTFKRMVGKAKQLRLLAVHETERKNGSQSANIYVFNRFEPPNQQQLNCPKSIDPTKTSNNNNNKRNNEPNRLIQKSDRILNEKYEEPLDASFVTNRIPKEFINLVKYFFNDAMVIEELWNLVKITANKNKVEGDILKSAIQSFKILVRKIKKNQVKNTYGYFYGVLNKTFKVQYHKELAEIFWNS
ncbi:hypothetical protein [Peribacillus glennii]|uniref:Helix-turn-helix domain-containing protein n=1 Tax=Peribacillus glennii TaxID=2303991 RepID=A0A372LKE2_9BACI|nr:hypothetical protein [Peribacillus glennii]RFU66676.1 hypothetical protein D0466_00750 [Peribacillus glennii]